MANPENPNIFLQKYNYFLNRNITLSSIIQIGNEKLL
jgi:hypothetical protein